MDKARPVSPGFFRSFRVLGDGLLAMAEDRIELFSVELQEEKFRLIQTFVWVSAAMFTGMMAVAFASITLVCIFRESARVAVLCGLTVAYAAAMAAIIVVFRRILARRQEPFAGTLGEIRGDRSCIRNAN